MWSRGAMFILSGFLSVCAYLVVAQGQDDELAGLFPVVFNLATRARISANATCGERGPEVFCKLVEHVRIFPAENRHCDICDARSENDVQRHPISNAVDGSQKWWQSPTLTNGGGFNYVTITLDLGQIYQIAYIIIKAANAPRPGNWILERSIDGQNFLPWQYFAMTDRECEEHYGTRATHGVPTYLDDDQVICTTRYSALNPLEGGEIFVSLVNGRPGVFQPSKVLLEFTSAKFVRLSFQKIRTLNADLMTHSSLDSADPSVTRRYYYSIKDISIGGQCICYGHASFCRRHDTMDDRLQCQCLHNTAGDNCEKCLPLYNQKPWQVGGIQNIGCEECNCHGKAVECVYNATVDAKGLSLNMEGQYDGGGVCLNCQEYTTGINCERCEDGYYRPAGMTPTTTFPCRQCNCRETQTSTNRCVPDDSRIDEGLNPGDCICKEGYTGPSCNSCLFGYFGYPNCRQCRCNAAGSADPNACDRACVCKTNVEGSRCDQCKPGYFYLDRDNPDGCTKCFCFGVSTVCQSVGWGLGKLDNLEGWVLSTLQPGGLTLLPRPFGGWLEAKTYLLKIDSIDPRSYSQEDIHYWVAPMSYLGNRLSSYGGYLQFTIKYSLDDQLSDRYHLSEPNLVLEGSKISITSDRQYLRENVENVVRIRLTEDKWRHLDARNTQPVTREEMMTVLYNLNRLLIRATYHTAQDTVYLKDVFLDMATPMVMDGSSLKTVEQCRCPEGYAGLSCESCSPGWRRINDRLYGGACQKCECYNHASGCDPVTGLCLDCRHNTMGNNCERCLPGFFGDPRRGTEGDCKPCACPLVSGNNFFAERCVARPTRENRDDYECVNCREGYTGVRCEMCAPGYYGNPIKPGGSCRRCNCGGNIDMNRPGSCNNVTGACNICASNTEGEYCERCRSGYYGSAVNGDCRPCDCYEGGSNNVACNPRNGQCSCRERFTGRRCDRCQRGYGNIERGCERCYCDRDGSERSDCDPVTGQCSCKPGIGGLSCNRCESGYYDLSRDGCKRCNCYGYGTNNSVDCDPYTGRCICKPGVMGERCDACQDHHYGLESEKGCSPCACNRTGSRGRRCDERTGQCRCQPNVGGRQCDRCQPGYYGLSRRGCRRCEPCDKPGHTCDQITGQCVCPPNTEGPNCEICTKDGWGYDKDGGCKNENEKRGSRKKKSNGRRRRKNGRRKRRRNRKNKNGKRRKKLKRCKSKQCNCSVQGSVSQQCDAGTGACQCLEGYAGFSCDRCIAGFYNFADCTECACSHSGVIEDTCITGICECDGMGQCFCKENVEGKMCDRCRPGTFSLDKDNPKGCTECYCFLRGSSCQQAPYVWRNLELPIQLSTLVMDRSQGQPLLRKFGHLIINDTNTFVPSDLLDRPLYWELPPSLPSDMILSYNGKLSFVHYFEAPIDTPGRGVVAPLVIILGNGIQIHSGDSSLEPANPLQFDIPLHEDRWRFPGRNDPISRRVMMVVLQRLEGILIRAVESGRSTYAELGPITLQQAEPPGPDVTSTELALGVEMCECPDRYSGESCQNPGRGYYRVLPDNSGPPNIADPEAIIGYVKPCQCYGHSDMCHPETGMCLKCLHNTAGDLCEKCADGYYGIATRGTPNDCQPCACPLPVPSNNFSPTCVGGRRGMMCTDCEEGYTGVQCESCAPGYYGNPQQIGDICRPCNCNSEGSESERCDPVTGLCPCISGIQGRTCEACSDPEFGVDDGRCVSCYTGCTGILLADIANLSVPLIRINISDATYPWERLYQIEKEANELRDKLAAVEASGVEGFREMQKEADRYHDLADNLIDRSRYTCDAKLSTTGAEACRVNDNAAKLLKNATDIEQVVEQTYEDIKELVEGLDELIERLIYNQSGVNMTAAFENAKRILDEILARDFSPADRAAKRENMLAEQLSEKIRDISLANFNATDVVGKLKEVRRRLEDLVDQTREADGTARKALDKIQLLKDLLARLAQIKDEIKKIHDESYDLLTKAEDLLSKAETNLITSSGQNNLMDRALAELQRKVSDLRARLPRLEQLSAEAVKHALDLRMQAEEIDRLFERTRDLSGDAVTAAKAYKSIVDAIREAKKSANDALKAARESRDIANVDELKAEVERLIRKSLEQNEDSEKLLKEAQGMVNTLTQVQKDLNNANMRTKENQEVYEEIKRKMDLLPTDFMERLAAIKQKNKDTEETIQDALDLVRKINNTLGPKMADLKRFDINAFNFDIGSELARVKGAADDIRKMLELERKIEINATAAYRKTADINHDLNGLRAKIDDARSRVNAMKMTLQSDGKCHRSYRSELMPSATNEIRFAFKLNGSASDMLMVLLQQSLNEFLAAEIRDSKVRFTWNSGKGQGSVSHSQVLEADKWYQVVGKRVGSVGQLKVWNMEESTEQKTPQETASMGAGCSLMNLNKNSSIFLAGPGEIYQSPLDISRRNFVGCIGEVFLDGHRLGVYNFKKNEEVHCTACMEVPQVSLGSSKIYVFNGRGFAKFEVRDYSSVRTKIELEFKTFYEDSKIFFVGNPNLGDFLTVELRDGRVYILFNMGGKSAASIMTNNTYNNNQWTKITFDRRKLKAVLLVGSERIQAAAPGPSTGLDLQGAPMYYGGLPSTFRLDKFKNLNTSEAYFYGCMRNLNFMTLAPDDDTSVKVNVQASSTCRENGIHNVDFRGNGYLILQSKETDFADQKNDISLTFITSKEDGILFIARDIPGENYYSLSMVDGHLEARLRSDGNEPVVIGSNGGRYNDEKMHCVSLIKDGRKVELNVDDQVLATGDAQDINFNDVGDLYLGGSPIDVDDIAATNKGFDGCISDVIANGVLLSMSDAKQYKRADVGRCRFLTDLTKPVAESSTTEEETPVTTEKPAADEPKRCVAEKRPEIEGDAKSVANSATFFADITKVKESDLEMSFNFTFDFRTFYPDGLFGYLLSADKTFYFGIQLKNGKLEVAYMHNGQPVTISFTEVLNDGQWHSVAVKKEKDDLSAVHDGVKPQSSVIAEVLDIKLPLRLGGPDKPEDLNGMDLVTHSIRGCIRSLKVNGRDVNMTDTQVIQDVGGCFKNVEPGAYFPGDAWGVYTTEFTMDPQYTISIAFRTTSPSGVFVSSSDRQYGMTLELHEGKIKFGLRNPDGEFRAETANDNPYLYCDNKWHLARAALVNGELSVSVDGGSRGTATVSGQPAQLVIDSPLFIGGFEETFFQVASLSSDTFLGCIRNLKLNGKLVDWYALPNMAGIRKTACPVS